MEKRIKVLVLILFILVLVSKYQIFSFSGYSLCLTENPESCRIAPGDIIITSRITEKDISESDIGNIICTSDGICHELKSFDNSGFCTEGINPFSLNKCYSWKEIEGEILWRIPMSFYQAIIILGIGLLFGKVLDGEWN